MISLHIIVIHDNGTFLLDQNDGALFNNEVCDICDQIIAKRSNIESATEKYRPQKKKDHLTITYDGFIVSSTSFRSLYLEKGWKGLEFFEIPKSNDLFITECKQILEVDTEKRPVTFEDKCKKCGQFEGVYGMNPVCIRKSIVNEVDTNCFYRSDLEFAYKNGKSYPLIVSDTILQCLIDAKILHKKDSEQVIFVE